MVNGPLWCSLLRVRLFDDGREGCWRKMDMNPDAMRFRLRNVETFLSWFEDASVFMALAVG